LAYAVFVGIKVYSEFIHHILDKSTKATHPKEECQALAEQAHILLYLSE